MFADYMTKEEEEEEDKARFLEEMKEIMPKLDPFYDEDEEEWLEIIKDMKVSDSERIF